jgi:DNA-binding beta-propeller fold protein YncE
MRRLGRGPVLVAGSIVLACLVLVAAAPLSVAATSTTNTSTSLGVIATVQLDTDLAGLSTYDPANGNLYVPCEGNPGPGSNGTLRVISTANNSVVASGTLGSEPGVPVVDPWNGDIYIPNYGSSFVSVVSGASNQVVGAIRTESGPGGIALDAGNGDLYVPSGGQGGQPPGVVDVVSGSTNAIVATIPIGWYPSTALYDGANGNLYVLDRDSYVGETSPNEVTVISTSTDTAFANVTSGDPDHSLGSEMLDPLNADLYVGAGGGTIAVSTTTNEVVATFPRGEPGFVDAQGNVYLYQPGFPANFTVVTGSSNTVSTTFTIGNSFWGLTYDPSRGLIFSGGFSLNVTSVETHSQIETIPYSGFQGYWFPPTCVPNGDLYGVVQGSDTYMAVIGNIPPAAPGSSSADPLLLAGVALLGAAAGALVTFVVTRRRK